MWHKLLISPLGEGFKQQEQTVIVVAPLRHGLSVFITLCHVIWLPSMSRQQVCCMKTRPVISTVVFGTPDMPKFRLVMPPKGLGSSSILSCTTFPLLHNSTVGGSKINNCTSLLHWLICVQQCLTQKHARTCKTLSAMFSLDVCAEMALGVEIMAVSKNAFTVRYFKFWVYLNQSHG